MHTDTYLNIWYALFIYWKVLTVYSISAVNIQKSENILKDFKNAYKLFFYFKKYETFC